MINQPKNIARLCLIASISVASLSLVACGGNNDGIDDNVVETGDTEGSDSNTSNPTDASEYEVVNYNGSVTTSKAVAWTPAHMHENIRKIEIQGNNLVIMHRWHNGIINVPLATLASTPNFSANPIGFGVIETSGYNQPSTADDYIVGAGENELLDVWFSSDNSAMYALLQKPSADSLVEGEDSFGLFKVPVKADGTIASETINGKTVYHRMNGIKRVGDVMGDDGLKLTKTLPLADGQIVALDSNHNVIAVYSSDLALDENNSFELGDAELESWTSNENHLYLLLKNKDGSFVVQQRQLNDLSAVFSDTPVNSTGSLVTNKNSDYLAMVSGDKQVQLFSSNNIDETKEFTLANNATALSLSTDGQRLAVQTEKEGELVLIDINKQTPLVTNMSLSGKFLNFALADKSTLFVNYQKFDDSGKEIMTSGDVEKINLMNVVSD